MSGTSCLHCNIWSELRKRALLAGKVRITAGARPQDRAVNPLVQHGAKQLHRRVPAEKSGPQLRPISQKRHPHDASESRQQNISIYLFLNVSLCLFVSKSFSSKRCLADWFYFDTNKFCTGSIFNPHFNTCLWFLYDLCNVHKVPACCGNLCSPEAFCLGLWASPQTKLDKSAPTTTRQPPPPTSNPL